MAAADSYIKANHWTEEGYRARLAKQEFESTLRAALAAARVQGLEEAAEIRRIGSMMANICFNLGQHEQMTLDASARRSMRQLQREWDAALRALIERSNT
jgi:hypothetical protein